jgi:hypothetical protein
MHQAMYLVLTRLHRAATTLNNSHKFLNCQFILGNLNELTDYQTDKHANYNKISLTLLFSAILCHTE